MSVKPQSAVDPLDISTYVVTRRAWLATEPERAYDLVSAVSNISLWSPNAISAQYDGGAGPWEGAWFRGRNQRSGTEWQSRSQVQRAEPGTEFSYTVLGSVAVPIVRWQWTFAPHGMGTLLSHTWRLLQADPVLGTTYAEMDALRDATAESMQATHVAMASWVADRSKP